MGVSLQRGQAVVIPNCCECVEGVGAAQEVSVGRTQWCYMEELPDPFPWLLLPCFPLRLNPLL